MISVSRPSFWCRSFGLNVFSKCPGKVLEFSLSLHAQVWSLFMIGGIRCVVCFNCLVVYQSYSRSQLSLLVPWKYVWNDPSLILIIRSFNFLAASLYLRLSSGCRLIYNLLQCFRSFLLCPLTPHGYSGYLVWDLSSGVALQAAFCITLVNSAIVSSMSFAVLSGLFCRTFSSISFLNASQFVLLLCSFGGLCELQYVYWWWRLLVIDPMLHLDWVLCLGSYVIVLWR
jgi:hypothetical protein